MLVLHNQPMFSYSLQILQQYCAEIFISANDNRFDFLGYTVIHDEIENIGPMGGIYACLKKSLNPYNLVLACDMPLITGTLLTRMVPVNDNYDIITPLINNRPEPLYALYHKRIVKKIEQLIDSHIYSLQQLLSQTNALYIAGNDNDAKELFNANTPQELEVYEQIAKSNLS